MPGIFISHSSKDKPFVTKLAMDLVSRDIPVWFDNWELETGNSLIQQIYNAIDNSAYLVIVLSSSSTKSQWVAKELTAALTKEEQIKRQFIIPIKIENCEVPLSVADRVYADFSDSYLQALERFISNIKKLKLHEIEVPTEQQLVPVTFSKGLYLRDLPLEKRVLSILRTASEDFRFSENQIVVSFDETYLKLRERLIRRMENIEDDPFYTPEFERSFSTYYDELFLTEDKLIKGLLLLLNEGVINKHLDPYLVFRACHWFARIVRTQLYDLLYNCQAPGDALVEKKSEWDASPLGDNRSAAKFFEVAYVRSVDFGPGYSPYVHAWIDGEWEMFKDWDEVQLPLRLVDYLTSEVLYKYIVPQMVSRHLAPFSSPLLWDFEHYTVAPS